MLITVGARLKKSTLHMAHGLSYNFRATPLCIEIPCTVSLVGRGQYSRTLLHSMAGSIRGHNRAPLCESVCIVRLHCTVER